MNFTIIFQILYNKKEGDYLALVRICAESVAFSMPWRMRMSMIMFSLWHLTKRHNMEICSIIIVLSQVKGANRRTFLDGHGQNLQVLPGYCVTNQLRSQNGAEVEPAPWDEVFSFERCLHVIDKYDTPITFSREKNNNNYYCSIDSSDRVPLNSEGQGYPLDAFPRHDANGRIYEMLSTSKLLGLVGWPIASFSSESKYHALWPPVKEFHFHLTFSTFLNKFCFCRYIRNSLLQVYFPNCHPISMIYSEITRLPAVIRYMAGNLTSDQHYEFCHRIIGILA